MADNYILNIKPTISASEGRKLENDLNQRFGRVAKKFGGALRTGISGLKGVLAGVFTTATLGAMTAIGSVIMAMMTNPINSLNQAIDNALGKADNIATRAGQIGTTSGKLLQIQAVAESAGVKNFDMIISRFQTELQKSRTGESDLLKEFAGEEDTLEAFVKVIDSIKQLKPAEQNLMISKIFGERANLQLAEFMQADLVGRRKQIFGNRSEKELTSAVDRLGKAEDLQAILRQKTAVDDLLTKSRLINEGTVRMQNAHERSQLVQENKQMGAYGDFAKLALMQQDLRNLMTDIQVKLIPVVVTIGENIGELWTAFKTSKVGKWIGLDKVFK